MIKTSPYKVLSRIEVEGTTYQPGASVDLRPAQADFLLSQGAIEPIQEATPPAAPPAAPIAAPIAATEPSQAKPARAQSLSNPPRSTD